MNNEQMPGVSPQDQNEPIQPVQQPVPQPQPTATADVAPQPQPVATDEFAPEVSVSWSAMEDIPKERPKIWYVGFVLAVIGLFMLALFVFRSWTFAILVPVMATAVLVLAFKPGKPVHHTISAKGVYIGDMLHDFSEFRAFGLIQDRGHNAVMLLPVKRFSPGITLYFDEEHGEKIVDLLGARLPMQEIKPDAIERFIRFIRL